MASPVQAIAAEGALVVAPAATPEEAGLASRIGEKLRALLAPSPRSLEVLQSDVVAVVVNGAVPGGSQAQLGESVADCLYAVVETGDGMAMESPLMRLLRSVVKLFFGRRQGATQQ